MKNKSNFHWSFLPLKLRTILKTTEIFECCLSDIPYLSSFVNEHLMKTKIEIVIGDLFRANGDILLCPTSENFMFSNPLSRNIYKHESLKIKKMVDNIHSPQDMLNQTGNCIFLEPQRLKYRGVIFMSMDYYSTDKVSINFKRIIDALVLASKMNCGKLVVPFLKDCIISSDTRASVFNHMITLFARAAFRSEIPLDSTLQFVYNQPYMLLPENLSA